MFFQLQPSLCCLFALSITLLGRIVTADNFSANYDEYNEAKYGKRPIQTFMSNPDVIAPLLQVNVWNEDKISSTGGSHIFIRHDYQKSTPLILDARDLSLVYVNRQYDCTSDIRVQREGNNSYLTFYEGPIVDGHGNGYGVVMDEQYNKKYKVSAQGLSVKSDLHEFQLTGHGTALVTAYELVKAELRKWRGPRWGWILDSVFQEIDLETQEVLFEWRALDHVDPADSFSKAERKWDFFHINSVQKSKEGNYLISGRHTHSIYLVNGQTGEVMWTLGGKKNDFRELDAGDAIRSGDDLLSFAWQHHARFYHDNENELTFFDNHVLETSHDCKKDCSRGLHVRLGFDHGEEDGRPTAQILHEFLHPQSLQAQSQGSVQTLEDGSGNVFVGWGRCPTFTEHTADGEVVMDVQFSPWHTKENTIALDNYRAYRMDWKATPSWNPDVMATRKNGTLSIYASWNGATEVRAWAFLASNSSRDLHTANKLIAIVPRAGFETSVPLDYPAKFARVAALDGDDNILASSGIVNIRTGTVHDEKKPVTSVLKPPSIVITDEDEPTRISVTIWNMGKSTIFGIPVGYHAVMVFVMLLGLMLSAWYW